MHYSRRILFPINFFLLLSLALVSFAQADQIENLIESEQVNQEKWRSQDFEEGELPPQWLLSSDGTIELYSSNTYGGHGNNICEPLMVDELADLSNQALSEHKRKINIKNPRVRDKISQSCLARPEDRFVAVGKEKNTQVFLDKFLIAYDPPVCPADPAYSLHASFEPKVSFEVLYFQSNPELKEGDNNFVPVTKFEKAELSEEVYGALEKKVPFLGDYKISSYKIEAENTQALLKISKRKITSDDSSLRNEAIFSFGPDGLSELILERVEKSQSSGHVSIVGTLDFNHDGRLDLLVEGDHDQCPFKVLFRGEESGFSAEPVPNRPCSC